MPHPGDVKYGRSGVEGDLYDVKGRQDDEGEVVNPSDDEGLASSDQQGSGPIELLPKHTIFLSHSGKDKAFVYQLCTDLEAENYFPFFDRRRESLPIAEKFPELILEAARTCLAAVVVLSEDFLTSKWPMIELMEFANAQEQKIDGKTNPNYNSSLKLLPVFYKIGPDKFKSPHLDVLWDKLVKNHLGRMPSFDKEKYLKVIRKLCGINGLSNEYGNNETKYRRELTTQIIKLVPAALPIDTSGIQACERLCKVIFELFKTKETKYKGKDVKCKYLGLHGKSGAGKTTICCEAMCYFYQVKYRGRFCRVRLDNEGKAAEGKASDGAAVSKKRFTRLTNVIKQLVGVPKSLTTIMTEKEGQAYLKSRLHHIKQPVFLVIDNVSESSVEEAKWYVGAEFPPGSCVLVTSRRLDLLKVVLGGGEYCERFPILDPEEALALFLSSAARSEKSPTDLEAIEQEIVEECLSRCSLEDEFIPRLLTMFASFLKCKGEILGWKEYIDLADNIFGYEYDNLDDISKLMLLDLGVFASDIYFTHVDFHAELEWEEHDNFKLAIEFLSMLHGIPFHNAEKKVRNLQGTFLEQSGISVSEDYADLPFEMITRDGEEKKWCMLSLDVGDEDEDYEEGLEYFYDLPNENSSGLVRVSLRGVSFDRDLHRLPEWKGVKLLQIEDVRNLPILDLQGLRSLRVLIVSECEEMLKIVCSCNSLFSDDQFCYEKKRGCLSELRVVQLTYLPKLEDASFARHCRRLETLWFYECPHLGCLPDLRFCRKLKRLRLPCGDFTGFQGLKNNEELTELAFHWARDTVSNFTEDMRRDLLHEVTNLTNLKILDIVDEQELYDWIPAGFPLNVGGLKFLTFLDLSCSSTIEKVEGLELLSELASLGLYGCCELRTLQNLHKFKKLKRLCISHCHKLEVEDGLSGLAQYSKAEFIIDPEPFHGLGESCSFGQHECLDVNVDPEMKDYEAESPEEEDEDDEDEDEDEEEDEEPRERIKSICRQCDPEQWEEYVAKDLPRLVEEIAEVGSPRSSSLEEANWLRHNFVIDVPLESLEY